VFEAQMDEAGSASVGWREIHTQNGDTKDEKVQDYPHLSSEFFFIGKHILTT